MLMHSVAWDGVFARSGLRGYTTHITSRRSAYILVIGVLCCTEKEYWISIIGRAFCGTATSLKSHPVGMHACREE